jgi:Putative zinc-finger
MTCLEMFELLESYHAGTLSQAQAEAVEQHLLGCDACRADFHFQRTLRARTAALPREIAPAGNLWNNIRSRIGGPAHRSAGETSDNAWWQRKSILAAAAAILVLVTSATTALIVRRETPASTIASGGSFQVTEAAYREATLELSRTLELRRDELSPAALAVVEHNLRIIDEAIRETQAALAVDPRNQQVAELLWASYEKKIDLLQRAAEHAES